jgi:hypothetical protein
MSVDARRRDILLLLLRCRLRTVVAVLRVKGHKRSEGHRRCCCSGDAEPIQLVHDCLS